MNATILGISTTNHSMSSTTVISPERSLSKLLYKK